MSAFTKCISWPLWLQVGIAMLLGIGGGLLLKEQSVLFKPIGEMFLNMVKMLVVPLVLTAIISAVTAVQDMRALSRLGLKFILGIILTTVLAAVIGIAVALIAEPGKGVALKESLAQNPSLSAPALPTFSEWLVGLVPSNMFASLVSGNMLQMVVIGLLIGSAIYLAKDKGKPFREWVDSAAVVMHALTGLVMRFSPIGVFALLAWMVGTQDLSVLMAMVSLLMCVYAACLIMAMGGYSLLLLLAGYSPVRFFKNVADVCLIGASTTSSAATLPVTMQAAEKLGISDTTRQFVLPIGVSLNMHGTVINICVISLFVAQSLGTPIELQGYGLLVLISLLASFGTAGVPMAGIVMISLALSSLQLPVAAVALVLGIYRLLDSMLTPLNVLGDLVLCVLLDRNHWKKKEA